MGIPCLTQNEMWWSYVLGECSRGVNFHSVLLILFHQQPKSTISLVSLSTCTAREILATAETSTCVLFLRTFPTCFFPTVSCSACYWHHPYGAGHPRWAILLSEGRKCCWETEMAGGPGQLQGLSWGQQEPERERLVLDQWINLK